MRTRRGARIERLPKLEVVEPVRKRLQRRLELAATVEALKQYPKLNASIDGDSIVYHAEENLGFAVDTERGLLAPVIRAAGDCWVTALVSGPADGGLNRARAPVVVTHRREEAPCSGPTN